MYVNEIQSPIHTRHSQVTAVYIQYAMPQTASGDM